MLCHSLLSSSRRPPYPGFFSLGTGPVERREPHRSPDVEVAVQSRVLALRARKLRPLKTDFGLSLYDRACLTLGWDGTMVVTPERLG